MGLGTGRNLQMQNGHTEQLHTVGPNCSLLFSWYFSGLIALGFFLFQALAIGCKVNYCPSVKVILSHLHLFLLWQLNSHHWPIFIFIPIGYRLFQFCAPLLYYIDQAICNLVLPLMSFTNIHLSSFLSLPGKYLVDAICSSIAWNYFCI